MKRSFIALLKFAGFEVAVFRETVLLLPLLLFFIVIRMNRFVPIDKVTDNVIDGPVVTTRTVEISLLTWPS